MLIPRDHGREVLEIGCELLQFDHIIRLYVIPTPYELVKSLFFRFFICYNFWMTLGIINLANLLKSDGITNYLAYPFISINDRFISIFVGLASEVI